LCRASTPCFRWGSKDVDGGASIQSGQITGPAMAKDGHFEEAKRGVAAVDHKTIGGTTSLASAKPDFKGRNSRDNSQ